MVSPSNDNRRGVEGGSPSASVGDGVDLNTGAFGGSAEKSKRPPTPLQSFIKDHDIHSPEPGVISVNLKGLSAEAFIQKAMKISGRSNLVYPQLLQALRKTHDFGASSKGVIRIDGYVEGSETLSISQRRNKGYAGVSRSDATVAHVANNLLNETDLFCGFVAQCSDGFLSCGKQGVWPYKVARFLPSLRSEAVKGQRIAGIQEV